jgi:outer membrane lipoprotein
MRIVRTRSWLLLGLSSLLSACISTPVVPPPLESQVDPTLTFAQVRDTPDSYRGRMLVIGGEVLAARRVKDGTRIEILQIPLDRGRQPVADRTTSEGRFLALHKDALDPATLPPGTRLTLVGEVAGAVRLPMDEVDYAYPILEVKSLTIWPAPEPPAYYYYSPRPIPYWRSY